MTAQDSCLTLNRQKLLDEINKRSLKRELLAEEIGVTPRTLRRWLHGHTSQVRMTHLDLLAQTLQCAVQDLIADVHEAPMVDDADPVLGLLRQYVLQGCTAFNFESATRLIHDSMGGLSLDKQAAALFEYARLAFQLGQTHAARLSFERAVMKADAAGMDAIRFQSFLGLAHISSFHYEDSEQQTVFLEQAEHVLMRMRASHWRPYLWLMEARQALNQGKLEKALTLGKNASELLSLDPDQSTLDTLEALDILASIFQAVGSRRKAQELLVRAESIAQKILAPGHAMRGRLLTRQSAVNGLLGECERSCQQAEEAVRILSPILPVTSYDRTSAWIEWGASLLDLEQYEKGIEAMQNSMDGHPDLEARHHTIFGLLLHRMGRHEESAEQGKKAVELFTVQSGPKHPDTAAALGRYAAPLASLGKAEIAEKIYGEAARLLHDSDPFHVRILDQVRNRASCLMTMGRQDEAAQILSQNRKIYTKRDESLLYQGRYSLLQAQALAARAHTQKEALRWAVDAQRLFQSPGVNPKWRHEADGLISTLRE